MTAHPVVETRFEQKDVDETHYFAISKSVEYFVKFEVPEYLTEKYNSEPQKHIFQVYYPPFNLHFLSAYSST